MVLGRLRCFLAHQRQRGRAYQPNFPMSQVIRAGLGALLAITLLGLLSAWSHYPLVAAPFGASTMLLFGHPESPLAQPSNIVAGNTLAALISVGCVLLFGTAPWVMGLAVGLAIACGQLLRCLHPPAGAVALLGVLLAAKPSCVLMPVLSGSLLLLLLLLLAVAFSHLIPAIRPYPHHWLEPASTLGNL